MYIFNHWSGVRRILFFFCVWQIRMLASADGNLNQFITDKITKQVINDQLTTNPIWTSFNIFNVWSDSVFVDFGGKFQCFLLFWMDMEGGRIERYMLLGKMSKQWNVANNFECGKWWKSNDKTSIYVLNE